MDVINVIENRRSIRKYKNLPVTEDQINKILDCGRMAPSAKNRQPWFFVVISDKSKIEDIANIMINSHSSEDEAYDINILKTTSSVLPTARIMKEAAVLILVYQIDDENWTTGDNLSIGACIENMSLAACNLGLGSLWIRDVVYTQDKIMQYINLKKVGYKLNSALTIGVPNEKPKARPRKKINEVVKWIK